MSRRKNRAYCKPCVQADNYTHTSLGAFETNVMRLPSPVAFCAGKTARGHACLSRDAMKG